MKTITTTLTALTLSAMCLAQGDFTWAIHDNYTPQHDNHIFDLARDSDNNLLSVGRSAKSSGTDNQLIIYKHSSDGDLIWKSTFNYQQYITDAEIEVSPNHDIAVVAAFRGDITIGSETYNAANSQEDIVLFKLDSSGAVLWSVHDGRTPGGEGIEGLTVDGLGNVYYAGKYSPFTSYVGTDTLTNGPGAFIAAYDANGNYDWHMYSSVGIESVASSDNHLYVYGITNSVGSNIVGDSSFSSSSGSYLAKVDFDGSVVDLAFEKDNVCREIIVTSDNRILTTGFFSSATAVIAGETLSPVTANIDSYIGRYDIDLAPTSVFQLSVTGFSNGYDLASSSNGHYALLGQFAGDLNFAGSTITDASGFSHQVFVLEFDENDAEVEVYHVTGASASTSTEIEEAAISAGSNDDFYINGYLKGKAVFGTKEVDPGGNKIHAWLAQIGQAGALGTVEIVEQMTFDVYPNPFSDQVHIEFGQKTKGKLKLIDHTGRVVHSQPLNHSSLDIAVGHLVTGTYFLHVELDSGVRYTRQVIVI